MKSAKFLDQLKETKNLKNDVALCKLLGWSSGRMSQYRSGKNIMDNEACLAVAMQLGIDPVRIIMAADIDRAERAGQHSLWEVFTSRTSIAASVLAVVCVNLFLTPTPAKAAPVLDESARAICIM